MTQCKWRTEKKGRKKRNRENIEVKSRRRRKDQTDVEISNIYTDSI
jgi:hypothetical protein